MRTGSYRLIARFAPALFVLGLHPAARADSARSINFQGRLTTPAGAPVANGAHNVQFSLYDGPAGTLSVTNEATAFNDTRALLRHGQIVPNSEVVKKPDGSVTYARGTDYTVDNATGILTRTATSTIPQYTPVAVSYQYTAALLWQESKSVTTAGGVFSTALGDVTPLPPTLFVNPLYYLEIKVEGETMSPREPLRAAPYALALPGLRTELTAASPNLIGGFVGNYVQQGTVGAVVSGGGEFIDSAGNPVPNRVLDNYGFVGGGWANVAGSDDGDPNSGTFATVAGGQYNTAYAPLSFVGGGFNSNATGWYSTISGGLYNYTSGIFSTVGGGEDNDAAAAYATIAGGGRSDDQDYKTRNRVTDDYGTIGGGGNNRAGNGPDDPNAPDFPGDPTDAPYATVGGGEKNAAMGGHATIAGGQYNSAGGFWGAIGGGYNNSVTNSAGTVPGGSDNVAGGLNSFAAGSYAHADHDGAFVWADNHDKPFASTAPNEFAVRATSGVRLVTAIDASGAPTAGIVLPAGGGGWEALSDRENKENFLPVDPLGILQRVAAMPVQTWNYKTQPRTVRHIGPTAQDFMGAFRIGENEHFINTVDADGVSLAAIQGLYQLSQDQQARITALEEQNAKLEARLKALETLAGIKPSATKVTGYTAGGGK